MRQLFILLLVLSAPLPAQRMPIAPSALSNRDVLTLVAAGFSEDFIVDTITASHTRFDTSATALADLAKHAVTERIIRVMMDQPEPGHEAPAPAVVPTPAPANPVPRPVAAKVKPAAMAISAGTPYTESRSVLWGWWKKETRVGPAAPAPNQVPAPHLGPRYRSMMRAATP